MPAIESSFLRARKVINVAADWTDLESLSPFNRTHSLSLSFSLSPLFYFSSSRHIELVIEKQINGANK